MLHRQSRTWDEKGHYTTSVFAPQCTDCGVPETIGYLKYICRVFQGEDISTDMEEMNQVCQALVQKYESKFFIMLQTGSRQFLPPAIRLGAPAIPRLACAIVANRLSSALDHV